MVLDTGAGTIDAATTEVSPEFADSVDVERLLEDLKVAAERHANAAFDTENE